MNIAKPFRFYKTFSPYLYTCDPVGEDGCCRVSWVDDFSGRVVYFYKVADVEKNLLDGNWIFESTVKENEMDKDVMKFGDAVNAAMNNTNCSPQELTKVTLAVLFSHINNHAIVSAEEDKDGLLTPLNYLDGFISKMTGEYLKAVRSAREIMMGDSQVG